MSTGSADCIFCKIARGAIPSQRVFEDERAFAFLDINPVAEGHTIVVPKLHAPRLTELPPEMLGQVAQALGMIARRILAVTGAPAFNLLQNDGAEAGQVVMHVHFHIIPRRANDKLGFRWPTRKVPPEQLAALAARIASQP